MEKAKHGVWTRAGHQSISEIAAVECLPGQRDADRILSSFGPDRSAVEESKVFFFLPMAELTGTFWENYGQRGEHEPAFGSHVIVHLFRDVLASIASIRSPRWSRSLLQFIIRLRGRVPTRTDLCL